MPDKLTVLERQIEDQLGWTNYTKLKKFFQKTWELEGGSGSYQYRVYTTGQCVELNDIFFELFLVNNSSNDRKNTHVLMKRRASFTSQHGLMWYVASWTRRYIQSGIGFPRVLVVELLIANGLNFNWLYYQLRRIVRDTIIELRQLEGKEYDEEDAKRAQYDLWSKIDILTFRQNMDGTLLHSGITNHICVEENSSPVYWRSDLLKTIRTIQDCRSIMYQYLPSVYGSHLPVFWQSNTESEKTFLSPFPMFGRMREGAWIDFKKILIDYLPESCQNLRRILQTDIADMATLQAQLVSFILSVYSACDLSGGKIKDYQNNLSVCAMNFGTLDDMEEEIFALYHKVVSNPASIHNALGFLNKSCEFFMTAGHKEFPQEFYIGLSEDILIDIAIRTDRYLAGLRDNRITLSSISRDPGKCALSEYLTTPKMQEVSLVQKVSVLLLMIERQNCVVNYRLVGNALEPVLEICESAKTIWPARLRDYIPALVEIEYFCQVQHGTKKRAPEIARKFFEAIGEKDVATSLVNFIKAQYDCGNTMSSWSLWWQTTNMDKVLFYKAEVKNFLKDRHF